MASKKYLQVSGLVQSLGYSLMIANGGKVKFAPWDRYYKTIVSKTIDLYRRDGSKFTTNGNHLLYSHMELSASYGYNFYHVQISAEHFALFPSLASLETWARQELAAREEAEAKQASPEQPALTFTAPDGETVVTRRHADTCDCEACVTYRWQVAERENQRDLERRAREETQVALPAPTPDDYSHYYGVEAPKSGAERDPGNYPEIEVEGLDEDDDDQETVSGSDIQIEGLDDEENESPADRVVRRLYSAPTPRRVVEEW